MKKGKIFGYSIGALLILVGLSFAFGFLDVAMIKTVGKAKQNAQREVFEKTQSHVFAKRQEALKYYQEYRNAETEEDRETIRMVVRLAFAETDDNILQEPVKSFIMECKYY